MDEYVEPAVLRRRPFDRRDIAVMVADIDDQAFAMAPGIPDLRFDAGDRLSTACTEILACLILVLPIAP